MPYLHHHPLDPHSRFVRLALGETGVPAEMVTERPWERSEELLLLNPAGTVPVYVDDDDLVVPGAGLVAEYLDERYGHSLGEHRLLPIAPEARVEVRRLMDWFLGKFHAEVCEYLVTEKVLKRYMPNGHGGGSPDMAAIRAGKANVRYHLRYVGYLVRRRNWLAGEKLTYADLAAAAAISVIDYLGDVPWDEDLAAKDWYARVKSRPSFRPLLNETVMGTAPSPTYADLDF
jgi:glutathione S-transferase